MTAQRPARNSQTKNNRCDAPATAVDLAAVRKALDAAIDAHAISDATDDARAENFRTWRRQTIADLIGLSRLCHHRRCRRKRRCTTTDTPCIAAHRDDVRERLALLLGYSSGDLFDDDDVDLTW